MAAISATSRDRMLTSSDVIRLAIARLLGWPRLRLLPFERLDLLGQARLLGLHLRERAAVGIVLAAVVLLHAAPHAAAHDDHHQAHPDRAGQQGQEEQRARSCNQHLFSSFVKVMSYRTVV